MKLGRERRRVGTPILDLIEEAIALLRRAPAMVHFSYYVGAIPFWLGVLYFLSDMSQDAFAASRVLDSSLGLALLYVWKKSWQVASAAQLRALLTGRRDEPWTLRRIWRVVAAQAALHPWGLILRPIAAVFTVPIVWTSAFFQNVTMLGDGIEREGSVLGRSLKQAMLWPLQAHGVVSILSLFSLFVWLDFCIALALGPQLLKLFFGIETEYTRNFEAYLNTTFFTASIALTSLAVDPLRKAIFVIRCFHGSALNTGEDLAAELREFRARPSAITAIAASLVLLLAMPQVGLAEEPPVEKAATAAEVAQLERKIGEVLERRDYTWRAPRAKEAPGREKSMIAKWFEGLGKKMSSTIEAGFKQLGRFMKWIRNLIYSPNVGTGTTSIDWIGLSKAIAVVGGAAALGAIVWLIVRSLLRRRRPKTAAATTVALPPDLRSENLVADQLPEDGWRELARDYAARGELVLAQRAAWLAGLAHLGHRELIGIARYKSNREYDRELRRRARDRMPLLSAFDDNLRAFERSWYGKHEVSRDGYVMFEENLERIRTS